MEVYERIKILRKEFLKFTQEEFAEKINVSRSNLGNIETNRIGITDRVIDDICTSFNVNKKWLLNGTGEIFLQTESSVISELAKEFNATDLEIKLLKAYFAIDKDVRSIFMSRLIKNINSDEEVAEEISIDKEISSYRQELEAQKRGMEKSSATPTTKDA